MAELSQNVAQVGCRKPAIHTPNRLQQRVWPLPQSGQPTE
jgi:hypothetical protein